MRNIGLHVFVWLALPITVARAWTFSEPLPLDEGVAMANVVAEVRVEQIVPRSFQSQGESRTCGTDYAVEVLHTLKGEHLARRSFSVVGQPQALFEHTIKPGDRMLVLLVPRAKRDAPNGEPADVVRGAPSREEMKCREALSTSTVLGGDVGGFPLLRWVGAKGADATTLWIAYARTATKIPAAFKLQEVLLDPNCTGEACDSDGRRMIPWEPLKAEIQRWVGQAARK